MIISTWRLYPSRLLSCFSEKDDFQNVLGRECWDMRGEHSAAARSAVWFLDSSGKASPSSYGTVACGQQGPWLLCLWLSSFSKQKLRVIIPTCPLYTLTRRYPYLVWTKTEGRQWNYAISDWIVLFQTTYSFVPWCLVNRYASLLIGCLVSSFHGWQMKVWTDSSRF